MFIKQIIIQGFKSYKEQTVIEPFSPKHNVIVGRNGSGKSNFFAAIRFVLSDAYTQMAREERQALLHEGSGSAVMSAYVEVIFDNTDERFPTGKHETILRRTIGLKKDEYSLDRKNTTKSEVMELLESAGFSRSNPYYIVPQGRVTTLTNMKDPERLNLLKEVAGTKVYEARRTESLKIMTETNNKRAKIDELLDYIKERLNELEEEKEELRNYQDKDKERRCLEYTIFHREQLEIASALEAIDEQRQTGIDDTDGSREEFIQGERKIEEIEAEIKDLLQQLELLMVDRRDLEDERKEKAKAKAKIELEVKGLSDGQSAAQQAKARYKRELQTVQASIRSREEELAKLMPEYNSRREQEAGVKGQLDEAEAIRQRLYAKQGRNSQFRSKRERDDWLRKEISDSYESLARLKAVRMQTTEEVAELEAEIHRLEADVAELQKKFDGRANTQQEMAKQVEAARIERERLIDKRKEMWREEAKLDSIVSGARKDLEYAERVLSHTMDQNTSRGIAAVRNIKRQLGLDGVYGTLAELIEVNEKYRTAVEVTAGNSLFHYVVDSDETATKVLEVLQRDKLGRVTFMPLNRLRPKRGNIPNSNDAIPMIEKIQYDRRYDKALEQVFGKTIICPNLAIAAQYARSHGVNAITPEGDRSDKKGALTGGFYDSSKSRLEAMRNVSRVRDEYEAQRSRDSEIKRSIERIDQEITRAVGELQKAEQRRQQLENSYAPLRQDLRNKMDALQRTKDQLDAKRRALEKLEGNIKGLTDQQSAHEAELASDFKKALTPAEEGQLERLSTTVQELRRQYADLSASRSELDGQKAMLEVELRENLRPRLDQLRTQEYDAANGEGGEGGGATHARGNLAQSQRDLTRVTGALGKIDEQLASTDGRVDETTAGISELEGQAASLRERQREIAARIEWHQRRMEKSSQKRAALLAQAAACTRSIRELGVLPEEAFEARLARTPSNAIVKRLHRCNDALKQYSHVNKKAFEQYANFTRQRDTLEKRRGELDSSQASIEELIAVLDQRKDEAIERTFKQVSRNFAEIFERLVPAGRGRLIIQRKADRRAGDEDESDDDDDGGDGAARRDGSVENYTGVGISVSFNSKHDDQQRIQQLSGGQKSLCALTLIFAIQQCDPAPFYLFDEIDANLDAAYRTAVANMLKHISDTAKDGQFICTTFRPEMLLVADKCYGVTYRNKTSSIDVVAREEALEFVEGQRP